MTRRTRLLRDLLGKLGAAALAATTLTAVVIACGQDDPETPPPLGPTDATINRDPFDATTESSAQDTGRDTSTAEDTGTDAGIDVADANDGSD